MFNIVVLLQLFRCAHCKVMAPEWVRLHETLGGHVTGEKMTVDIGIAKVDCTIETALCSKQHITGYPT